MSVATSQDRRKRVAVDVVEPVVPTPSFSVVVVVIVSIVVVSSVPTGEIYLSLLSASTLSQARVGVKTMVSEKPQVAPSASVYVQVPMDAKASELSAVDALSLMI